MGRRLILDTNVLVDYERGTLRRETFDDDDLAIAAVTVAEFRTGIEASSSAERAARRSRFLVTIQEMVEVLDYSAVTATHHARLLAHSRRSGRPRRAHDLIIAAHAAQTGRILISGDAAARFGDLPGVTAEAP